uniref:BHLH domain-containing protein n=1 Tax=Timema bartmani TaxID=61472 RepID=A0A7R9FB94_9NEOP|nr:unnamed protein product [Timema bartmani]
MVDTIVNSAFTTLRTLIPTEPVDRKLSKIETLRLASSYISHLQAQLVAACLAWALRIRSAQISAFRPRG